MTPPLRATAHLVFNHQRTRHHLKAWKQLTLLETDLGIKKKKKKKPTKEGGDDFAKKLAALDLDKDGDEAATEEQAQDGDM